MKLTYGCLNIYEKFKTSKNNSHVIHSKRGALSTRTGHEIASMLGDSHIHINSHILTIHPYLTCHGT